MTQRGGMRGRKKSNREGIYVYTELIPFIQQKLTQHCKAIIFQ